ncbi:hypothetical protein SETIT_7G221100v2, partial [Setaria italica]
KNKKVVFAESGKEFVDVLLSFLTLPLGTIVQLLGKESSLGCFDELYKSVESLDASHFQTKACKNILLRPLSAAGNLYKDLVVRIDDTNHRNVWFQMCRAGSILLLRWTKSDGGAKDDGAFVRGGMSYATADNLQVVPADTGNLLFLLRDMGIEDVTLLEEKTLELGLEEVISSISCIDNLHKSMEKNMSGYFKSDECRAMVLSPKLPPFFSCSDHFLMTDELLRFQDAVACCSSCIRNCSSFGISEVECSHGRTKLHAVNPKVPTITTETGDSYTKDPGKFLVTNELGVAPFSLINALSELKKKDHSVSELATREFTFTQAEYNTNLLT